MGVAAKGFHYMGCGVFDSSEQVKAHVHPGSELVYVSAGDCGINVNGLSLPGKPGTLFVLPSKTVHSQVNRGRVRTLYAVFSASSAFDDSPRFVDVSGDHWIPKWLEELFALQSETHERMDSLADGLLSLVMSRLEELASSFETMRSYPPPLTKALALMKRDFVKPLSLPEIAERVGVCPGHLCALFRKSLGKSPVACLLELRLQYAKRLLDDPYLSVKDLSERCGFSNSSYFCRRFRLFHGKPPGSFKRH